MLAIKVQAAAAFFLVTLLGQAAYAAETDSADNACADAAAVIVSGVEDSHYPEWARRCNSNPNKGICIETKNMIEQVKPKKFPPGPRITCD